MGYKTLKTNAISEGCTSKIDNINIALIFLGLVFFFLSTSYHLGPFDYSLNNIDSLKNVYESLVRFFNLETSESFLAAAVKFTAFAYTYHYLNWFSKVKVIGWYNKDRGYGLIVLYLLFIALYIYDYAVGFYVALILSFVHVTLEFPLNFITFKNIYQHFRR